VVTPMAPRHPIRQAGFTVLELVVTVSIIAIVAALAAPTMRQIYLTQYVRSGALDLQTALLFARSEAIKRATSVSAVPSGGKWNNGWTVQLADSTVLRKQNALSTSLSATPGTAVTYQSNGRLTSAPSAIVFATSSHAVAVRCVVVDLSGRPSVVQDSDGDGSNGCN